MSTEHRQAKDYLARVLAEHSLEDLEARLAPSPEPIPGRLPRDPRLTQAAVDKRWAVLAAREEGKALLLDPQTQALMERYQRNVENFVGTVKVPVGIAGPLRVNGLFAKGDYFVPLATSEAALVASYHRGSQLISRAGGCSAMLLGEGVGRAPGFAFRDLREAGRFVAWAVDQFEAFKAVAETTTRHGKLSDLRVTLEGNHVYLLLEYRTGDASGQNMVTFATNAVVEHILANSPVKPQYHFLEANLSGDKKASVQSFQSVRGKKVTAEVEIPATLVEQVLHTSAHRMTEYWRMSALGGVLSGTLGVQGHYANGLAAVYIACGQDAACVAESAVGVTRFELTPDDGLYASVTLPNLMVGTVGGGTGLPSQQACLKILGLAGPGQAHALAEVCAALSLAGELSIIGALCAGHFARAHCQLARG